MADSFDLIEATWFALRKGYGAAYAACTTAAQKAALTADRDGARDAYYLAVSKTFDEADAYVTKTKKLLAQANDDLKASLQTLADINATLKAVTTAVNLAAALAAMAT